MNDQEDFSLEKKSPEELVKELSEIDEMLDQIKKEMDCEWMTC